MSRWRGAPPCLAQGSRTESAGRAAARLSGLAVAAVLGCASESEPQAPPVPSIDVAIPTLTLDIVVTGPCGGLTDRSPCDDGSRCTEADECRQGSCVGTPIACDGGTACTPILCDPLAGCRPSARPDGASCTVPCYHAGTCIDGLCVGSASDPVVCDAPTDPCVGRIDCNPDTGACDLARYLLACPVGHACEARDGVLQCLPSHPTYCRPCEDDAQCADPGHPMRVNRCRPLDATGAGGTFCSTDCAAGCPAGASCTDGYCLPDTSTCACDPAWSSLNYGTPCLRGNEHGTCSGRRRCVQATLTSCDAKEPTAERCNALDDDCDGETDELPEGTCGPSGACCSAAGSCSSLPHQSCLSSGGSPAGTGVSCAEAPCGTSPGACCGPTGCDVLAAAACPANYRGDGTTCDACGSPAPTGACCAPDGACHESTVSACFAVNGTYAGHASTCAAGLCVALGACCFSGLTAGPAEADCVNLEHQACVTQGGTFDAGTLCDGLACPIPSGSGACCTADAGCAVVSEATCKATPGQFLAGEACSGQCQSPEFGACCDVFNGCSMRPVASCAAATAEWQGIGSTCPSACEDPLGACCVGVNCYPSLSVTQCSFVTGTWAGPDTTCEDSCVD